jgi:hypothetical protein
MASNVITQSYIAMKPEQKSKNRSFPKSESMLFFQRSTNKARAFRYRFSRN